MGRKILAVVAGVILAGLVVYGVQAIGHQVYPPPENLDTKNMEAMKAYVATLPVGAFLFVLVAYILGSFAGGWLAAKIPRAHRRRRAVALRHHESRRDSASNMVRDRCRLGLFAGGVLGRQDWHQIGVIFPQDMGGGISPAAPKLEKQRAFFDRSGIYE